MSREEALETAVFIHRLAETIDDQGLREGLVTAVLIRSIVERNKMD